MIVCLGTTPTLARTMEFARITVDAVNRAVVTREYAAGKAVNAARAIATIGRDVVCVVPVGGVTGERFQSLARAIRGEPMFVPVAKPTRLCITAIDRKSATATELIEEAVSLTPAEGEALLVAYRSVLGKGQWPVAAAVLAGSLAPGLAVDLYARCVREARKRAVMAIVDASGEALRATLVERPAIVKCNAQELSTIEACNPEDDDSVVAAALNVATLTEGWVIVTRGCRSTIAAHRSDGKWRVKAPQVEVVSAIGSGDSFAGGLAAGLTDGLSMPEALRLATACAAANAMTADAAHFELAMVQALRSRILIEAISV